MTTPSPLPGDEDREELLNALNANFFYADDDTSVAELRDAVLAWMERVDAAMTAYRGNVLAAVFVDSLSSTRGFADLGERGRRNASD